MRCVAEIEEGSGYQHATDQNNSGCARCKAETLVRIFTLDVTV